MRISSLKQMLLCLVKPGRHASFGVLCLYVAIAMAGTVFTAAALHPQAGTLRHEEMVSLSGQVTSLHRTSSGVRFQLTGHATPLIYDRSGRGQMHRALQDAGDAVVMIGRAPESRDPQDDEGQAFAVWSITVGDKSVQSLEALREDMRTNTLLARVLFPFFLALAVYWTCLAWKKKRKDRYPFG